MPTIRFTATPRTIGRSTIVMLPQEASAELPSRGQVAVTGVINGDAFQTVLEPDGRRGHWLKIDKRLQRLVTVNARDTVTLEIEPSKDWPEPELPQDFATALADAPGVHGLWSAITPMARWEWVRWISATRSAETRKRRIAVGISKLQSGQRRPCCFDLSACTDPDLARNGKLTEPA